jgi:hypothetical protein
MPIYLDFYSYFYKELFKADKYKKKDFNLFVEKLTTNLFYGDILYASFKDYTKLSDHQIEEIFEKIHLIFEMTNFDSNKVPFQITMLLNETYRNKPIVIQTPNGEFHKPIIKQLLDEPHNIMKGWEHIEAGIITY